MNPDRPTYIRGSVVSTLLLMCMAICGCVTQPQKPVELLTVKMPERFRHAPGDDAAVSSLASVSWWKSLAHPELNRLLESVLKDNPDLKIAELQAQQAQARAEAVRAGGSPSVTAPLVVATQSSASPVGSAPVSGDRASQTVFQAGLQASWRVDLWGEQSARQDSADLQVLRAKYEKENTKRMVMGNLLMLYVAALSLNDSMRIAEEMVASAEEVLDVVQQRYSLQDATVSELEQQRANVAVQRTVLPTLSQQKEDVSNQLSQLLGTTTDQLSWPTGSLSDVELPRINVGMPSGLLLRRPDVRLMEARMRAAQADVEVARAQFLPPLDLSIQAGQSAMTLARMLRPEALFWSAVGSLTASVFDGGRREAQTKEAQAFYEELVLTYGKVIYQSLREVESALSLLRNSSSRLSSQQQALNAANAILQAARQAHAASALDSGSLTEARRAYQRQHDEVLKSKADALKASVLVSQALAIF